MGFYSSKIVMVYNNYTSSAWFLFQKTMGGESQQAVLFLVTKQNTISSKDTKLQNNSYYF